MTASMITPPPPVIKAVQDKLAGWDRPVVTDYELGALVASQLKHGPVAASRQLHEAIVAELRGFGLIHPSKDFSPGTVYHLFGRARPAAVEVICAVDPFAYVSHLSAMEHHGLTDRFSKILYLTTPPDSEWREQANHRMDRDLRPQSDAYRQAKLPLLRRQAPERVEGMRIEWIRRANRGAFKIIKSPPMRVAMIGRTFLDMLREPQHCGGIQHVVDVYRESAPSHLRLIVEEVDSHGTAVEKMRAGYLLDEVCRLEHPLIDGWIGLAQRGGSRMLDPNGEYAPHYSEKWKLSINVASLMLGASEDAL